MVDVSSGPAWGIQGHGYLLRVARHWSAAVSDWLEGHSRRDGGVGATLRKAERSKSWDGNGGRHCPSYVKGWDPARANGVERIYYAGAADNLWGPYTIGFLEWNGEEWIDQPEPVFTPNEDWEHGSVYEPNLIYHDGKWQMWYVAGSNHEDNLIHGYAESDDGRTGWSKHVVFAPPEMKMFDFCVRQRGVGFDAIFARFGGEGHHRRRLVCGGAEQNVHRECFQNGVPRCKS